MTPGPKGGIDEIVGIGGGPIGAELIDCGPRFREDKVGPIGEGIGAELTEQIGEELSDVGPIGAAEFGKGASLE